MGVRHLLFIESCLLHLRYSYQTMFTNDRFGELVYVEPS